SSPNRSGSSVYGNGVGLIHHSSEAQPYSAERPQDRGDTGAAPAQPSGDAGSQRRVLLEWSHQ
ncbi:MAG TPA: hypothetical protein VKB78_05810, partial [Pirellulales bacterium]|nr:hypothetical protein [Pirellulales bacterium]